MSRKRITFDLDGCLCTQVEQDYNDAQPLAAAINVVNKLYDEGYTITIYTSRFMGRNGNDLHKTYHEGYEFTRKQLAAWQVKHHFLFMGKPPTDIVVDDRSVFFKPDWPAIEQQIREKLGEK